MDISSIRWCVGSLSLVAKSVQQKFRDAEAKVIGSVGPFQWECELYVPSQQESLITRDVRPNGIRFQAAAGTSEFSKRWNPQPGDIVTFKHRGFLNASKKPKFPGLFRVRTDLKWEDIVANWKEHKTAPRGTILSRSPNPDHTSSSATEKEVLHQPKA